MSVDGKVQSKTNGTEKRNSLEASELDPCMEDSKDSRKPNFFHRYRAQACERSGLSHKGLYIVGGIVILAFLLLIVVIALAAAWPRIPHRYLFPVCEDAECLEAAAQIQEGLNSSVSPCDDIWQAACGGWLKKYPLPKDRGVWNQKQQLIKRESERVRDLINTLELPLHTGTVEWKLKHLYEACLDVDNVNSDDARPLLYIISELVRSDFGTPSKYIQTLLSNLLNLSRKMRPFLIISALVVAVCARPEPPVGYNYPSPTAIPSSQYGAPSGGSLGGGIGGIHGGLGGGSGLSLGGFGASAGGAGLGHGGFTSGGIGGFTSGGVDLAQGGFSGGSIGFSGGAGGFSGGAGGLSGGAGGFAGGAGGFAGGAGGFAGGAGGAGGVITTGPAVVQKHVYVHVAPEEPEEVRAPKTISVPAPQKHYKIIFIKAPTPPTPTAPIIPVQPQNEEKTLVYVLVKKPEEQPDIEIPTPAPTQPSKPEVYFIKYRTQKETVSGGAGGGAGAGIGGGVIADGGVSLDGLSLDGAGGALGGHGIGGVGGGAGLGDISIASHGAGGISTGSGAISGSIGGSSGGVSAKYGPPGYHK